MHDQILHQVKDSGSLLPSARWGMRFRLPCRHKKRVKHPAAWPQPKRRLQPAVTGEPPVPPRIVAAREEKDHVIPSSIAATKAPPERRRQAISLPHSSCNEWCSTVGIISCFPGDAVFHTF